MSNQMKKATAAHQTEMVLRAESTGGMNAAFGRDGTIHCIAAEPEATFLRVGVVDRGEEVAYATTVLSRLSPGYRVLPLRSMLGTRIDLCYVFVKISFNSVPNLTATNRQVTCMCTTPTSLSSHVADTDDTQTLVYSCASTSPNFEMNVPWLNDCVKNLI